jgi:hypothetical protein
MVKANEYKEDCEKSCLELLKENYSKLQLKYGLPDFDEFNKDFYIEKLSEVESDYLIRELRKFMIDKFSNYLRFIEAVLNPVNAQMFVFSVIKTLGNEEKEKLEKVYKKLSKKEVGVIELDLDFSEKKEAEFINDSFALWQDIKQTLLEVVQVIGDNWDREVIKGKKDYFG